MKDLIISLSKNQLKVSAAGKDGFEGKTFDVPATTVRDSKILDVAAYASFVKDSLSQFTLANLQKRDVVFLVEPSEVFMRFIVLDKSTDDIDVRIVESAKEKLNSIGVSIDEIYFSYQKIAPFVYQFVAMRKPDLEQYIQISAELGMSLKAVIPWVLLLPKFLTSNDPCVFLIKNQSRNIIALAELNGIYYCEELGADKSLEEIRGLVQQLSVYKRNDPINTVYTVAETDVKLDPSFEVNPLAGLSGDNNEAAGYETHLLAVYLLDMNPDYLTTQVNLLSLLPVPVVVKKNTSLVYVGVTVLLVTLLGGLGFWKLSSRTVDENSPNVLSEQVNTEQPPMVEQPIVEEPVVAPAELNRSDLVLRVENGAGIAGIAGEAQTFLEEKGYKVEGIGNADESDRTTTLLKFKDSKKDFEKMLVEDLKGSYTITVEYGLAETDAYDVLMVVGSN